jgi:hypothetical protein
MSEKSWDTEEFEQRIRPLIDQMMNQRAWIMNGYSQLEFLLADLIVKARRFDEYADLNKLQLPFGIDNRIDRVRQLLAFGPFHSFIDEVSPLMDRLLELEDTRHFFTHGFVQVHITKNGKELGLFFRRYTQPKKGDNGREGYVEMMVRPKEMAAAEARWKEFSQAAVQVFARLYIQLGLETNAAGDQKIPLWER